MAAVSVSAAAGAGFELIGRKPLAVLVWGLAIFLAGVLPVVGLFAATGPTLIEIFHQAVLHPTVPPGVETVQRMRPFFLLNPLVQFLSIAFRAVLCGAVFRAVLTPGAGGFAYLRLGMREVWLAVLFLAEAILAVVLLIAMAIPVAIVVALAIAFLANVPAAIFSVLTVLAAVGLYAWILLRFSLAGPMTFEDGEFRLFESWALTRGHALQLLGIRLLVFLLLLLVQLACMVVFGILALALFGSLHFQPDQILEVLRQPPSAWIERAAGVVLAAGLVWSVLIAAYEAVRFAPFAAFYRMLRPQPEPPPPQTSGPVIAPAPV